ncbi:hypothetical protein C8F04DRAFT_1182828 [Mycena alexandri]|uniref:Uncharacterized protein n=1 Tax=Mycena alexandri TaxID=1745969 RepID=A0AAD6SVJ2_9AGAR|nr:hypothetical protein C8F04DRAFT_1182828 [Mycena alexandri]
MTTREDDREGLSAAEVGYEGHMRRLCNQPPENQRAEERVDGGECRRATLKSSRNPRRPQCSRRAQRKQRPGGVEIKERCGGGEGKGEGGGGERRQGVGQGTFQPSKYFIDFCSRQRILGRVKERDKGTARRMTWEREVAGHRSGGGEVAGASNGGEGEAGGPIWNEQRRLRPGGGAEVSRRWMPRLADGYGLRSESGVYNLSHVPQHANHVILRKREQKGCKKGRKKGVQSGGFTVALFLALFALALLLYLVNFIATKFISSLLDPSYTTELKRGKKPDENEKKEVKKGGKMNDPIVRPHSSG